jgi:serine/threonine protein kinase
MDDALKRGTFLRDRRFEIVEVLGTPVNKTIYRALDHVGGGEVALDVFSHNLVVPNGMTVREWETQVLAQLRDHPNVAKVLDHWEDEHVAAMATPYLTGGNLADRIAKSNRGSGGGLAIEDVFRLSIELAYGLAHIHLCGILYRDLQPRNVRFDGWGTLRLVDFDTAVLLGDPHPSDMSRHSVINYMAPELLDGRAADGRADLYSLGATMYEMVAGHPAFPGSREEVLSARQAGRPPALHREGLPEGLAQLIFGMLSPERNKRPYHAYEVAGCLEQLRAAHAKIQRLLDSDLDRDVLKTLETFLAMEGVPRTIQAQGASRPGVFKPNVDLPPDHRLLMQAIMALAEEDYRRAAIDAGTASEVALASAIKELLQTKGVNGEFIDQTILRASGIEGLFTEYIALGTPVPMFRSATVSRGRVNSQLAAVRNGAAHAGRIPTEEEATGVVELAHSLVMTAHPYHDPARSVPS